MAAKTSFCPRFHHAVELIGRRWTGALIRALMDGPRRYAQLRDAIPDLTDRMLSERLRELESEGVVVRRVVPETPVRVEYELTDKGRALQASVAAISAWAEKWVELASQPRQQAGRQPRHVRDDEHAKAENRQHRQRRGRYLQ